MGSRAISLAAAISGLIALAAANELRAQTPDAERSALRIEEIIVTGQKREQTLQEVNSSVQYYGGDFIDDTSFEELTDLYLFTPNVNIGDSEEGEFSIRGIFYRGDNASESGNTASVYVDGVFQSNLAVEAGPQSIFDLDSVEIYRGPQSTVQGRNSLAGAVIIRTQDPTFDWEGKARVQFAEFGTRSLAAALGGPLIDDQLAFRVSFEDTEDDGFIENPTLGIDDFNSDETQNVRAKLLWQPDAWNSFSALLSYVSSEGFAGTGFGTGGIDGPNFLARQNFGTNQTLLDIETDNWALTLSNGFGDLWTAEWVLAYSEAEELGAPRFPEDPAAGFDISTDVEETTTSDLRLIRDGERLSGVAGLYFFNRERARTRDLLFRLPGTDIFLLQAVKQESDNVAVYFDGEYEIAPNWWLLFGARYDDESYEEVGSFALEFVPTGTPNPIDELDINSTDTDFDAFLPKLGVRWEVNDDLSLSFVAQRGYRAGGAALDSGNVPYTYEPEYTDNYEFAVRSTWLDGRLSVNANMFYIDWTDQQVFVTNPIDEFDGIIQNAGESTVSGLEAEFTALLTEQLTLYGSLGILSTEYDDFVDFFSGDLSGNDFGQAPDEQWSLGFSYEAYNGLYATVNASYVGESFSTAANLPDNELDSRTVVNAKVGYRRSNWDFAVFARNLFDEEYFIRLDLFDDRAPNGFGFAQVGAPQVLGVELSASFGGDR